MEGILTKRGENSYVLFKNGAPLASTMKDPYKNLSIKNCNEIFGVVDVDNLALKEYPLCRFENRNGDLEDQNEVYRNVFKEGFNKAMELNKNKLFTVEDMKKAYLESNKHEWFGDFIQSLQQPTEIEVEIACMKDCQSNPQCDEFGNDCIICTNTGIPLLDSDGNLILKKI
jgi:hypothetical protein